MNNIEKELIKIVGKSIPNELIYNIYDDIEDLKKIKSIKKKDKEIKKILNELNEISSIADEALNDTKSQIKKDKILLFIEYNNKRIEIINQYKNTNQYETSMNLSFIKSKTKECPEDKILNPKTNRCVKKDSLIAKKLKSIEPLPEPIEKKKGRPPKIKPEEPIQKEPKKRGRPPKIKPEEPIQKEPKKRGRPAKPKKEKEIVLFPKITPELRELKKKLGSLIEPSRIYNIDWVINNIEKSGNSTTKMKGDAENELDYFKEIYMDVSNRRNEEKLRQTTRNKIDLYLNFEKNRIDKITEYISKLNQKIFDMKQKPLNSIIKEVKQDIKEHKLVCNDINTIPQFTGTCWFNSILTSLFYSQNSRNILLNVYKTWDYEQELFKILKTILKRNYTDKNFREWLDNIKPELILIEFLKKYDIEYYNGLKKTSFSNLGGHALYITKFLNYIHPTYNILEIDNYNNDILLNINYIIDYIKEGQQTLIKHNSKLSNDDIESNTYNILSNNPDYIIFSTDKNMNSFSKKLNKEIQLRLKPEFYKEFEINLKDSIDKFKKGLLQVNFNNNIYKLDSILLSNEKDIYKRGHSIAGITCDNERYVYNGWDKKTLDEGMSKQDIKDENDEPLSNKEILFKRRIATPCSLIKYDWDLSKNHTNFKLDVKKCELPSDIDRTDLYFNFSKGIKILIYVKINDKNKEDIIFDNDNEDIKLNVEEFIKDSINGLKKDSIILNLKKLGVKDIGFTDKTIKELKELLFSKLLLKYRINENMLKRKLE